MKAALEAAGVEDLAAARIAAAQRKEYLRRSSDISKELANLAPGDQSKKLAAGLEALKGHLGELRGRLKVEMEKCELATIPGEEELASDVANNHAEGARFAAEIETTQAELAGPQDALARADKKLQSARERLAGLKGAIETKRKRTLKPAVPVPAGDKQLTASAESLERDAITKDEHLAEKDRGQGDSVEAIDARSKRLEGAAANHQRSVANLGIEVTRLTALIEANEGAGVEEMLLVAEAERDRLASAVAEFEKEATVLQLLSETLEAAEGEAKTLYLAPVISRVEPAYLKMMLLPGADIVLDEDLRIAAIQRAGQREDFDVLSGGTQEQLAVLTRLAFAELLLGQGRPATVILDDALAFSDDDRIESMFDVLMRAGDKVQIIVLTCRKRLFTRLGAAPLEIAGPRIDAEYSWLCVASTVRRWISGASSPAPTTPLISSRGPAETIPGPVLNPLWPTPDLAPGEAGRHSWVAGRPCYRRIKSTWRPRPNSRPKSSSRLGRAEDYEAVYLAGLEWDLTDPIVIESEEDLRSTPRWRERLSPTTTAGQQPHHLLPQAFRLPFWRMTWCLGKTISAGLIVSELAARARLARVLAIRN